mgnify:CR=1 FL=1
MSELKQLQKAVADAEAVAAAALTADNIADYALYVADETARAADEAADVATQTLADAHDALIKAKRDLANYCLERRTMTKLEQLEKAVADTKVVITAAWDAADAEAAFAAYDDYFKAKLELKEYLKEQQGNE